MTNAQRAARPIFFTNAIQAHNLIDYARDRGIDSTVENTEPGNYEVRKAFVDDKHGFEIFLWNRDRVARLSDFAMAPIHNP